MGKPGARESAFNKISSCQGRKKNAAKDKINKGAFIRCRKPLRLTETCKLTIEFSDRQIEDVPAEVVWTNIYGSADDLIPRGTGVRFTSLPEAEQKSLKNLINMIEEERKVQELSEVTKTDLDRTP